MKEKLMSRKFWAAVAAAVGAIVIALLGDSADETTLGALTSGVKVLIAYICGETAVDVSRLFASALSGESKE